MNKSITLTLLFLLPLTIFGQCDKLYEVESPTRTFSMEPSGSIGQDIFKLPSSELDYVAGFASNLWIGGTDPVGNLKIAAATYSQYTSVSDYTPGPIDVSTSNPFLNNCDYFGRVWVLRSTEVEAVKKAYQEGNLTEDMISNDILEWPAMGNPYFDIGEENGSTLEQGVAPFFDNNGDGKYDVFDGDIPILEITAITSLSAVSIPALMTYSVYNDNTIHTETQGEHLGIEIRQTNYMLSCADQEYDIDQTLFTNYKITNRGFTDIRDLRIGLWEDNDLICFTDNLQGCAPELNTTFAYNIENAQDCGSYEGILPVDIGAIKSTILLDKTLSSFMYYNNPNVGLPNPVTVDPSIDIQFYNYLKGQWLDGTPMTFGGTGLNPGSSDNTSFAFSDLPNDNDGWSMVTDPLPAIDRRSLTGIGLDSDILVPGQIISFDLASHIMIDEVSTSLELFGEYENKVNQIKDIYSELTTNANFLRQCFEDVEVTNKNIFSDLEVDIFPNPANDQVHFQFPNATTLKIELVDVEGRLVRSHSVQNENHATISLSDLGSSMYFIKMVKDGSIVKSEKLVKF